MKEMASDQAAAQTLPEPRPIMNGGDGSLSYARNSGHQMGVLNAAKEMIRESIKEKLDFKIVLQSMTRTFCIADFGCSTGRNSFLAMQGIIEAVEQKYNSQIEDQTPLAFQVFFNDLTDNDFNTLFESIPVKRNYFAAGVPGSFYDRLFPKSSLHIAYSCYSLHWLSKVPEEVIDCESPAWNKGSIHCTGYAKELAEAYSKQFKSDFGNFLSARAQEIVNGGLMIILFSGRPNGILMSQTGTGVFYDLLGSSLIDMAKLGLIDEKLADSFNLPLYYSTPNEIEEVISNNAYFSLESMETLNLLSTASYLSMWQKPEIAVRSFRAAVEGLLKAHFGSEEFVEEIFKYFAKKAAENFFVFNGIKHNTIEFFILLKRNTD